MPIWKRPVIGPPPPPAQGPEVTDDQAFDLLCAKALALEPFPQEIIAIGVATGWAERIRRLGDQLGWVVSITITDKQKES